MINWYDGKSCRVVLRAQAFGWIGKRCSRLRALCFLFCFWLRVLVSAQLVRMLDYIENRFVNKNLTTNASTKHDISLLQVFNPEVIKVIKIVLHRGCCLFLNLKSLFNSRFKWMHGLEMGLFASNVIFLGSKKVCL